MLTVKQIEAAKPKEKPYRLLDGNGLYLYVPVLMLLMLYAIRTPDFPFSQVYNP